jgi:hypothetical protein
MLGKRPKTCSRPQACSLALDIAGEVRGNKASYFVGFVHYGKEEYTVGDFCFHDGLEQLYTSSHIIIPSFYSIGVIWART